MSKNRINCTVSLLRSSSSVTRDIVVYRTAKEKQSRSEVILSADQFGWTCAQSRLMFLFLAEKSVTWYGLLLVTHLPQGPENYVLWNAFLFTASVKCGLYCQLKPVCSPFISFMIKCCETAFIFFASFTVNRRLCNMSNVSKCTIWIRKICLWKYEYT